MSGCQATNAADTNCPEKLGPDYDFGGSSAILQTVNGKDILVAAGKGGVAIGLDPDADGKLVWRTQLWETQAPSASGLVVWGGTADGQRVYYPLQQAGGGLKALQLDNRQSGLERRRSTRIVEARLVRRVRFRALSSPVAGTAFCAQWMQRAK